MGLIDGLEHIVREAEPLAPYTWFRIGGVAEYFAEPTSVDELQLLVKRFHEVELPIRLIGGGSNVLIRDEGTPGLVILLSAPAFTNITVEGSTITAGGGLKLSLFVSTAVREGLSGPEQLVGIPGTVGGALHNNSGTHGGSIGPWLSSARVMTRTGEIVTRTRDELSFGYRQSSLNDLAILEAQFEFESEDPKILTKRMQKLWIVKKASHPESSLHVGCMFKDHGHESAGSLVERAGLKGTRVGDVEIAEADTNFFIAHPGAKTEDVIRLIDLVKTQVADRTGIELENGIEIW